MCGRILYIGRELVEGQFFTSIQTTRTEPHHVFVCESCQGFQMTALSATCWGGVCRLLGFCRCSRPFCSASTFRLA
jgi:hypothetical protein